MSAALSPDLSEVRVQHLTPDRRFNANPIIVRVRGANLPALLRNISRRSRFPSLERKLMNLGEEPENLPFEHVASAKVGIYDRSGKRLEQQQWVIRERPVTLYLNGREMVTLLCAGHHLDELAAGFSMPKDFSALRRISLAST